MAKKKRKPLFDVYEEMKFRKICDDFLDECNKAKHDDYYSEMERLVKEAKKNISETDWIQQIEKDTKNILLKQTQFCIPNYQAKHPVKKNLEMQERKGNTRKDMTIQKIYHCSC